MSFSSEIIAKFAQLHTEIVDVDPGMAKHLRETCHFERQRPITSKNVDRLAQEMRLGNFVKGTPIFMAVLPDNSIVIVNGNHCLEAVASGVITMPLTFIYHRVNNLDEAARIYIYMDVHKVRGWGVTLQAIGAKERIAMATKVLPAVSIILGDFDFVALANKRPARSLVLEHMESYADAALRLHTYYDGTQKYLQNLLSRAAFMSVALVTAQYQPKAAEEFWGGAARDDGLAKNDPRKQLLGYAIQHKATGGGQSRAMDFAAAVLTWNAFFENRNVEILKPNSLKEIKILGTNWHKGKPATGKPEAKPTTVSGKKSAAVQTGLKLTGKGIVPVSEYASK